MSWGGDVSRVGAHLKMVCDRMRDVMTGGLFGWPLVIYL